jgi:hypothetical protein
MSKHYLPIWLKDHEGNKYHVKVAACGTAYIVDAGLHKSLFLKNIKEAEVGTFIDYPLFYNSYEVIRNDLLSD